MAGFLVLLAALAVVVVAFDRQASGELDRHGLVTTGEITSIERLVRGGPDITVRFQTSDGREIRALVDENRWESAEVGDFVKVEYSLRDPRLFIRDPDAAGTDLRNGYWITAGLLSAALFTLLAERPVRRLLAWDKMRTPPVVPPSEPAG